jgi:hypothetical protein
MREAELRTATNRLVELNAAITTTRNEIVEKNRQLRQMQSGNQVDRELLALLEGRELSPKRWTQLREELGIGWNCSEDYVLVSKRILKAVGFNPEDYKLNLMDAACDLLMVTPEERIELDNVVRRTAAECGERLRSHAKRIEPAGEVVAQYTIPADPTFQQGISNKCFIAFTKTLGPDRAGLLFHFTRPELGWMQGLPPTEALTMTVRRSVAGSASLLQCEIKKGSAPPHVMKVRYAYYPGQWFLTLFPGGWADVARREGFELPKDFYQQDL